jgi:4-amino-4-deoxy-L-arabinose transferase-like glycosyltransferase
MPQISDLKTRFGDWKNEIRIDERWVMPLIIALGGLFISISIGYTYALSINVGGWQLWTWLVTIIIVIGALLMAAGRPPEIVIVNWRAILAIVIVALFLRYLFLETIPGGLHVDEYGIADFSLRHIFAVAGETLNPFRSGPASHPSLYHYLVRLSLALAGASITGLRLSSVIAGVSAILATYAMVVVFDNRRTALISIALMAGYHFHIHWSRIGLNNIWDTLWVPATLALFAWGWKRRWYGGAILAGATAGLSQYFYPGSRLGLILLLFVIWRLWREERDSRRMVSYGGLTIIVALCVVAPLLLYAIRDPVPFFERTRTVFGWRPETIALVTGNPPDYLSYTWHQLWRSVGAFTSVMDVTGFYDPKVPLLIGLSAPLFIAGFFWAIYKRQFLPVVWIVLTIILGGFILSDPPGSSHYAIAIPAIVWLVAMPINWLAAQGHPRLAIALVSIILVTDLIFYFAIYVPGGPRDLIHPFPPIPPL